MKDRNPAEEIQKLLRERIVILDGPMGTMIQTFKLDEAGYRGHFKNHPVDLRGNNDLLCLTRPEIITNLHRQYLEAGADIIETNTFNSNALSMADYKMESMVYELNVAAAKLARSAADEFMANDPGRLRFVAGAAGPTNRTASLPRQDFLAKSFPKILQVLYRFLRYGRSFPLMLKTGRLLRIQQVSGLEPP